MKILTILFMSLMLIISLTSVAAAQTEEINVPSELEPFVEQNTKPIAVETADLNGDGLKDFILVLEKQKAKPDDEDIQDNQRPLLIIIRNKDNQLTVAKRNEKMIYCSTCGGISLGDAFQGVIVGRNTFTVSQYGGSAWRWVNTVRFNYSARDKTWQLVLVKRESFHTGEPEKVKTEVYTPPKSFGKIDIGDFDPENFKNQGSR